VYDPELAKDHQCTITVSKTVKANFSNVTYILKSFSKSFYSNSIFHIAYMNYNSDFRKSLLIKNIRFNYRLIL
jgi:hypothetical protein